MTSSALIYQIGYVAGMKRLCATVALLVATLSGPGSHSLPAEAAAGVAFAGGREWVVTPPAGWHENAGLAAQLRENIGDEVAASDSAAWQSPDGRADALMVQWLVVKDGGTHRHVDAYDRDFRSGLTSELGDGVQIEDRPERIVDGGVIRDSVLTSSSLRIRAVRHYRGSRDGLHVLAVTCSSEPGTTPCDAAIDSARFAVANAVALTEGDRTVLRTAVIAALILLLGSMMWRAGRFRRTR